MTKSIQVARLLAPTLFLASLSAVTQHAAGETKVDKFFSPDHLVRVDVEIDEDDWNELRVQTRTFATAIGHEPQPRPYTYFRGNVTVDGERFENVGIRKKGFIGSLDDDRPSLKIKFSQYGGDGSYGTLDRITLNNNKQDPTLVSQYLSYKMFRDAGVPASRCNFAVVTVNGKSLGVYSNVESVRPPFLARQFGSDKGKLYEGTLADFFVDRLQRFEGKSKRARKDRTELEALATALEQKDDVAKNLAPLLDVDGFLTFWATESLIGFWDGYSSNQNNFFIYHSPQTKRFSFIPWGTDASFTPNPFGFFRPNPKSVFPHGLLASRLYHDDPEPYRKVILGLLDTIWNEDAIVAELDRVHDQVVDHVVPAQGNIRYGIDRIKGFVKARRKQILSEMEKGPVKVRTFAQRPMYMNEVGKISGTFSTSWSAKQKPSTPESGTTELNVKLNGETVELKELGVSAQLGRSFGPAQGGPRPPTLVFAGKRASDGKQMTLTVGYRPDDFRATTERPAVAQGMLMTGQSSLFGFNFGGGMMMVAGTTKFESAGSEDGDKIVGTVELTVMEMRGGPFGTRSSKKPERPKD